MSVTYQPKNKKRRRTHGYLARKKTKGGRAILKRRKDKKRWRICV